jgi:hypothetical protein
MKGSIFDVGLFLWSIPPLRRQPGAAVTGVGFAQFQAAAELDHFLLRKKSGLRQYPKRGAGSPRRKLLKSGEAKARPDCHSSTGLPPQGLTPRFKSTASLAANSEVAKVFPVSRTNQNNPRIHESTNPRIHESTNPRIHESTNPRIHESTNPRIHESTILREVIGVNKSRHGEKFGIELAPCPS